MYKEMYPKMLRLFLPAFHPLITLFSYPPSLRWMRDTALEHEQTRSIPTDARSPLAPLSDDQTFLISPRRSGHRHVMSAPRRRHSPRNTKKLSLRLCPPGILLGTRRSPVVPGTCQALASSASYPSR